MKQVFAIKQYAVKGRCDPFQFPLISNLLRLFLISALFILTLTQSVQGAGVTIITHGFASGAAPKSWVDEMQSAICSRVIEESKLAGSYCNGDTITVKNKLVGGLQVTSTPSFSIALDTSPIAEIIIKLDWSDVDSLGLEGKSTQKVAKVVFDELYDKAEYRPLLELPIHLIGHSRGASLITELARLLGEKGIWVDHITTLDPYPLTSNISTIIDAPIAIYKNVLFSDNYYQKIAFCNPLDPCGEYVDGSYNRRLINLDGGYPKPPGDHGDVHLWYHGTIDLDTPITVDNVTMDDSMRKEWYSSGDGKGATAGFYYSRIGGGNRLSQYERWGYHKWLGGEGDRDLSLDTSAAEWPNIMTLDIMSGAGVPWDARKYAVTTGETLKLRYSGQDFGSGSCSIEIYLDTDRNPYNNSNPTLIHQDTRSATGPNTYFWPTFSWNVPVLSVGKDYYVYAKISDSQGHTRYLYAKPTIGVGEADGKPILSNSKISHPSGTESTPFEFLVDYYDSDGDPPLSVDYQSLIFSDGSTKKMTLKPGSGTAANGTYSYTTTLPAGMSYRYKFSFVDRTGKTAELPISGWFNGPEVYSDGDAVINPVIQTTRLSSDLKLGYSFTGEGNWTYLPISNSNILPPIVVPSGSTIWFTAEVGSPNFTYTWRELRQGGNLIDEYSGSPWSYSGLSGEYGLNIYYQYTPQQYTISGTVLSNGSPIPGGVVLTLNSSEQTMTQTSSDGTFSFTGVNGGVPVTIIPSVSGYAFTPSSIVYSNLKQNDTAASLTAYASDTAPPTTSFVTLPSRLNTSSSVGFSWIGQDDESSPANLLYQYKLDGVGSNWSAWASTTNQSYDLPNGAYTFRVRARDEVGNINQAPISYKFVVNAAPEVVSAVQINESVWASRVTLNMPKNATNPTNTFILVPQYSGSVDTELVPVRIHRAGDSAVIGANAIVASKLGVPAAIAKTTEGWLVTLPNNIPAGQSEQYDVIWGKIKYFGWQDSVNVPAEFPSGGNINVSFLDDDLILWRSAFKWFDKGGQGNTCDRDSWLFLNSSYQNGAIVDEDIIRFIRGDCRQGTYGTSYMFMGGQFYKIGTNILLVWRDRQFEIDGNGANNNLRYGLELFDSTGNKLNETDGTYVLNRSITFPKQLINNSLWLTGVDPGGKVYDPRDAWFIVLDEKGNEKKSKTNFDTIQNDNYSDLNLKPAIPIGSNILLLWERMWQRSDGDDRQEIAYQILDSNGDVVKSTAKINPSLASDSTDKAETYDLDSFLTDNSGKVWISYRHYQSDSSGTTRDYYYVILDTDGSIWKGPVRTTQQRTFDYVDRDGYIWASENGQFFALNSDDTLAVFPRKPAYSPTQDVGQIAAEVNSTGYRLYDRWSPQLITINVPAGANPTSMELFDLNMWDNDLHPANVNIKKGDKTIWNQNGQYTGYTTIDVAGTLSQGTNVLTVTQSDFLGGQMLRLSKNPCKVQI